MKTITLNSFVCGLLWSVAANASIVCSPATTDSLKDNAKTFFSNYLWESASFYTSTHPIDLSATASCRQWVWNIWKEVNQQFEEEKLIPLDSLSKESKSAWHLPESLEPHAVMPYYWGRKGTVKPADGWPLYLYLHGSGPKQSEWTTGRKLCLGFNDAPSVYFIPQIPNEQNYYRWWQKAKQYAWEKLLRLALVSGNINPDRIYLFGISEGGYGSQRLASFYADYLAGAGPMAGGEPLKNAPAENCANIAFSLRTGARDNGFYRNELTQYVKEAFQQLQYAHPGLYTHQITLIPEAGHHIDYRSTTPWLKQYTRNPYPHYVYWEDFDMDGLHRKGFYNLYVNERKKAEEEAPRTCYEMNISGNAISLEIKEVTYETTRKDPKWGIDLQFAKHYAPAKEAHLTIFLCNELVDLNKKVTLTVNGKRIFKGKVNADIQNLLNSCATFSDPRRLYPAAIEVQLENGVAKVKTYGKPAKTH